MYDLDAVSAINVDQIVTATDRLLLGAISKRRMRARGSSPAVLRAMPAEKTVYVRGPHLRESLADATGALIAISLVLWVAVTFARLLA